MKLTQNSWVSFLLVNKCRSAQWSMMILMCSVFCYSLDATAESQADITIQSVRERLRKLKEEQDLSSKLQSEKVIENGKKPEDQFQSKTSAKPFSGPPHSSLPSRVELRDPEETSAESDVIPKEVESPEKIPPKKQTENIREKQAEKPTEIQSQPVIEAPIRNEGRDKDHLFGDWSGRRRQLLNRGCELEVIYKGEGQRILSGGLRQRNIFYGNLDVKLGIDGERAWDRQGLSAFAYVLGDHGADNDNRPTANVGDIQGTSNIETSVNALKLYEMWVEQRWAADRVSLLLGLHDLNSEFYVTEASAKFFNSSFGVGRELSQTGVNGPSIFPSTALAVRGKYRISEQVGFQVAAFGAKAGDPDHPSASLTMGWSSSDSLLWIAEVSGKDLVPSWRSRNGVFTLGVWKYQRDFDHLTEKTRDLSGAMVPTKAGSSGFYGLWNQELSHRVSFFVRSGWASTAVNQVRSNWGTGVVRQSPMKTRPLDSIGLAFSRIDLGSTAQEARRLSNLGTSASEITTELYYRYKLRAGVDLQADIQWVDHPSQNPPTNNALVGTLRAEFNF